MARVSSLCARFGTGLLFRCFARGFKGIPVSVIQQAKSLLGFACCTFKNNYGQKNLLGMENGAGPCLLAQWNNERRWNLPDKMFDHFICTVSCDLPCIDPGFNAWFNQKK